uniref:Ig-like domain-containing protein n=1 Tax=Timema bartmani TaxID=61472 RepID=A0A7R9EWV6_9NEOP|nr:unnamed protein product [Timema bartmani]
MVSSVCVCVPFKKELLYSGWYSWDEVINILQSKIVPFSRRSTNKRLHTLRWFRQDRHQLRVITETDDRMFVVGECLAILHVDEGDAGRWVCVANNTAGVERIDLTLQVTSSISIMIQPSGQLTVDVGGRAEMQCIVTGSLVHKSSPTWLKDGHVIGPVGTSLERLILENVQRDDAGMYQCIIRGEDDSAQSSVQLQLGAAHPQLLYKFINQTLQPGPPVSIKCIATGNPTPHIIWHLDGFPLPQNESSPQQQQMSTSPVQFTQASTSPRTRYTGMIRDTQTPVCTLDTPVHTHWTRRSTHWTRRSTHWTRRSTHFTVHKSDWGLPDSLVENQELSHLAIDNRNTGPQLKRIQTLPDCPAPPRGPSNSQSSEKAAAYLLDKEGERESREFVIGQYVTLHGDVISHVNISNVQVEDGGIYQCTASNRVGEISHSADMRVYGLPFIRPMPNISAVAGEPLYIACPVAGYPIELIIWEKGTVLNSHRLPTNRRQHVFPNGTLFLENVQKDADRGEYRCRASNNQGQSASQMLPLNVIAIVYLNKNVDSLIYYKCCLWLSVKCFTSSYVAVPPRIAPFSFQTDLHLGDRAGVQCFVTKGDLPLKIEWHKDGAPIEADVEVRQLGEHISSLSIETLRPHHAGIYKCQASNSAAQDSHSSRLLVNVPPRIGPFTFGELIEGVRTQVQCVIQAGDPPLTLKWLKDDEILPLELGIQVTQDAYSSTLAIPRVSRMHAGNYTCIAGNPAAKTASVTAQLVVSGIVAPFVWRKSGKPFRKKHSSYNQPISNIDLHNIDSLVYCESVPPRWVAEPRDHKVSRDETVMFHCQAEGFPNPTLIWRKIIGRHPSEYQDVTVRSRGLQLFSNGTLYIRQALPEHQGQYLCEATNGVGAGLSALVMLTVHVPPMFEVKSTQSTVRRGASQTLQCQAHGDGPMSIVWQREDMRLPAQLKPRYDVKETTIKGGFLSELHISNTVKSDSGTFNCIAKNPFGRSERTVHLQVQGIEISQQEEILWAQSMMVLSPKLKNGSWPSALHRRDAVNERIQQVKRIDLCFNCLKDDGDQCNREDDTQASNKSSGVEFQGQTTTTSAHISQIRPVRVLLSTALIDVLDVNGDPHVCRVLLDSGSHSNSITEELVQRLDAPGRPQDLRVLDCGSRRVKLAWLDPTDDHSPILQYIVQYQQESQKLGTTIWVLPTRHGQLDACGLGAGKTGCQDNWAPV